MNNRDQIIQILPPIEQISLCLIRAARWLIFWHSIYVTGIQFIPNIALEEISPWTVVGEFVFF